MLTAAAALLIVKYAIKFKFKHHKINIDLQLAGVAAAR